jgi:4-hydroxy-3-polyprenylbenzoate decarboxylase
MEQQHTASTRSTIEFLKEQNELLTVEGEVNPILEIAGIQKALDGGPVLLFNNIKGYAGVRTLGNLFARKDVQARIFGVRVVEKAPCQEVVITDNINVLATIPVLKHTERDGARVLGGGINFLSGKYFRNGTHVSFNRMTFKGKDWGTIQLGPGNQIEEAALEHKGERIPFTVNICPPPAVMMAGGAGFVHTVVPIGSDKVGMAGGLQGFPVDICKTKTVDAYAIANSEWVLEGYINTAQRAWESEAAEGTGKLASEPLFPEYTGYLGKAARAFKLEVTAITHRKDRPIFHNPLAHSIDADHLAGPFREACFYELAERIAPGLVVDVNALPALVGWADMVIQVKKRMRRDEGYHRNILTSVLGSSVPLKMVILVDEDVDIYSADDILWAIATRVYPPKDVVMGAGGRVPTMNPLEMVGSGIETVVTGFATEGPIGIDATVPFETKWVFERAHYPSDRIDLTKWFSPETIDTIRARQSEWARVLARTGG